MKQWLSFFSAIFFLNGVLQAQFPSFDAYSVGKLSTVSFRSTRASNRGKNKAEVPPWIIPGGYRSYFFVDGVGTNIWSSPSSLATNSYINLDNSAGPARASGSYTGSPGYRPDADVENWKRNYDGIYSAVYFRDPVVGPVSLGFLHGENKNVIDGDVFDPLSRRYQNTIQKNVRIDLTRPETYSGGMPYHEGWDAYNAFISAAWIPNNRETNWGQQFFSHDMGPIAWPSTGYVTATGIKCTSGLRHPSSIIFEDTLYVFYVDGGAFGNNIPDEDGRREGVKVIKTALGTALDPHSYRVYYRGPDGKETWAPSLPEGFTRENMLKYIAVKGPRSTDLMDDSEAVSQELRFCVAHVRNTNYFIGVEEYIDLKDAHRFKVALRFSADLVHWTDRRLIISNVSNWSKTEMNYPIFLSKDGWSNTEVDIDDFYVLGTGPMAAGSVNRIHIRKSREMSAATLAVSASFRSGALPDILSPNPNAGSFRLAYSVASRSALRVNIYDAMGRRVWAIAGYQEDPGRYVKDFDIRSFASGIYLVEVLLENKRQLFKMLKE